jgi:acyl-CoA synthetase (AMP-forming)/AMP-acid ligase II
MTVSVVHSVREHARLTPDHPVIAERAGGGWRQVSYGQAVAAARAIGQGLLDRGLGPDRPLLVLSGNSVDHLLVTLGALTAGVPVAPVSAAYSLASHDHARIRAIAGLIHPGAVFAEDAAAPFFSVPSRARPWRRRSPACGGTGWPRSCSPLDRQGRQRACSTRTGCWPRTSR